MTSARIACNIRRLGRAAEGVAQEGRAQPHPLPIAINGKPGRDHDRNGMSGKPFAQALRSVGVFHLTDGQAEIPCNRVPDGGHIGLGAAGRLARYGVALQEDVQGRGAAVEVIDEVRAPQLLREVLPSIDR